MQRSTLIFISILCGIFTPIPVAACELHAGMGGFSRAHPLMHSHFEKPAFPLLRISHDQNLTAIVNEPGSVAISYHAPPAYQGITVEIMGSENIQFVEQPELKIDRLKGSQQLRFLAANPGLHHITLLVRATRDGVPVSFERRISIHAS